MNSYGSWLGAICDIKIANVAAKIKHKRTSAGIVYVIIRMCSAVVKTCASWFVVTYFLKRPYA